MKHNKLILALTALMLTGCGTDPVVYDSFELPKDMDYFAKAEDPLEANNTAPLTESHPTFANHLADFSGRFIDKAIKRFDEETDNSCLSPTSLYGVIAMLASSTKGDAQSEITSMLGMSMEEIESATRPLVENLSYESDKENTKGICAYDNAIFTQDGDYFKQAGMERLADKHYASSYKLNFMHLNKEANNALEQYVERKTHGLIKPSFNYDIYTRLIYMNTLYLKTIWSGFKMSELKEKTEFVNRNDSKKKIEYLRTPSLSHRRQIDHGTFRSFGIPLTANCSLRLMVPTANHSLNDLTAADWTAVAHENYWVHAGDTIYHTTVYLPSFTIEGDFNLNKVLQEDFGVRTMFTNPDFSPIVEGPCAVSDVRQLTKIIADKEGVEGAAVTIADVTATAVGNEPVNIYEDFWANQAFAYEVVNEKTDAILFAGFVNSVR